MRRPRWCASSWRCPAARLPEAGRGPSGPRALRSGGLGAATSGASPGHEACARAAALLGPAHRSAGMRDEDRPARAVIEVERGAGARHGGERRPDQADRACDRPAVQTADARDGCATRRVDQQVVEVIAAIAADGVRVAGMARQAFGHDRRYTFRGPRPAHRSERLLRGGEFRAADASDGVGSGQPVPWARCPKPAGRVGLPCS